MMQTLKERLAELDREREEAEPWCIDKRVVPDDTDEDRFSVVDARGVKVASYRELLLRGRCRDFIPEGDPPNLPGTVAVFHPAAYSIVGDLDVAGAIAKRHKRPVFAYQDGGRWWSLTLVEPEYGEGRNLILIQPNGAWKMLGSS